MMIITGMMISVMREKRGKEVTIMPVSKDLFLLNSESK